MMIGWIVRRRQSDGNDKGGCEQVNYVIKASLIKKVRMNEMNELTRMLIGLNESLQG